MKNMTQILYLMRHGETEFNKQHKIQGWCDSPLTEFGRQQAQIAGKYFKEHNIQFDAAFSSTSERASDTLELVTDTPYTRVKGLKEWNFGVFEGESETLNPAKPYGEFFVPYGGESEIDLQRRMSKTILDIVSNTDANTILMVSHAGALRQFMRVWRHTSDVYQEEHLGNCAILKYSFDGTDFQLLEVINHDF